MKKWGQVLGAVLGLFMIAASAEAFQIKTAVSAENGVVIFEDMSMYQLLDKVNAHVNEAYEIIPIAQGTVTIIHLRSGNAVTAMRVR
jgi:pyruvate/2-oxoglutarate/acetoin dehydrogenase E1 component